MVAGELAGADGVDEDVGLWMEKRNVLGPGLGAAFIGGCATDPPPVDGGPEAVSATFSKFSFDAYGEINLPELKNMLAKAEFFCIEKGALASLAASLLALLTGGEACRCFSGLLKVLVLIKTSSLTDDNEELLDTDPDLVARGSGDFELVAPFCCGGAVSFLNSATSLCISAGVASALSTFNFFAGGSPVLSKASPEGEADTGNC